MKVFLWPCDSIACVRMFVASAYKCIGFAEMITCSQLLDSTLPAPDTLTSPTDPNKDEEPRQSHPKTVQAFNVAPYVLAYISGLPATKRRFKPVDDDQFNVQRLVFIDIMC